MQQKAAGSIVLLFAPSCHKVLNQYSLSLFLSQENHCHVAHGSIINEEKLRHIKTEFKSMHFQMFKQNPLEMVVRIIEYILD